MSTKSCCLKIEIRITLKKIINLRMLQMHLMQTNTACKYNTYNSELNKQSNWRRKAKKQLQFSEKK